MTEFILKLLGAPMEDATRIADASLAFRGGVGLGWFFLYLAVLGGLIYWVYRQGPGGVPRLRQYILTGLRILFVALILMLLVRPVLALTVEGSVRRLLVMLMDTSASMQMKDNRLVAEDQKRAAIAKGFLDPQKGLAQNIDLNQAKGIEQATRVDLVKSALKNEKLNLLPRLDKEFDMDVFTFGQGVAPIAARKDEPGVTNKVSKQALANIGQFTWVDQLSATNPNTAIGDALHEVMNRKRGQPLAGVLLVTDGANNSGSQPREVAALLKQEGLPLYVYGVGITSPRDVVVGNIFAPEISFAKDEIPLTVRINSQGLSNETAEIVLKQNGETVVTKSITLAGDGEQVIPMKFTPQTQGEFELQASIEPRPDEPPDNNKSRGHHLRVIDAKIKVLMIEQAPRWEFRYLQAMLTRDRRMEVKCLLFEGDQAITRGEKTPYLSQFPINRDELFKYDLIVFGDVAPKFINLNQMEMLARFVSDFGGAFVMVAGKRFSPHAYRRTPLEKLLPVEFDSLASESSLDPIAEKPIRLELTAAGRANPMLRLSDKEDENINLWKQLPPVYWVAKVARPKPAAEVLLVDPDPAKESRFGKMPVVALQQYGLGQVMYVGTDNTWRWRKNVGDMYYTTIWGQIAQRVSLQRFLGGSKRTQLTSDRQNYMTGERVSIFARLYNIGFDPMLEPSIKAFYGLKNGQGQRPEVLLRALPEQPGLYRAEFIAPAPGVYQFWVEHDINHFLDFSVTPPTFELGDTAMNERLLKDIVATTGGAMFREENLVKLPETISAKTERVRSPLEVELWSSPLYFLLMLGVVTAEWILRKMANLK